jgi:hypothetical protein
MRTKKSEVQLNVRFPPEVLEGLRLLAAKHQRSLNGEVVWLVRVALEEETKAARQGNA